LLLCLQSRIPQLSRAFFLVISARVIRRDLAIPNKTPKKTVTLTSWRQQMMPQEGPGAPSSAKTT
jgi:hypothetical protein